MASRTSLNARNAALAALNTRLASCYARVYTGAQPATPETAASGTLLAELRGSATFGTVSSGVLTANAITQEDAALATGTPGYVRFLGSDGTTVEMDGAASAEVTFTGLVGGQIIAGGPVTMSAFTYTLGM